jgi:DNA-binding transcriptional ArsR family regulator
VLSETHSTTPPDVPPLAVVDDPDQAAALVQPERRRLLEALAVPDSAAGLARRFGLPRQQLNYHLRELERVGLVGLVEERRKGNCIERVVRATARAYVISPDVLGALGSAGARQAADRFSAVQLVNLAARAIRDVGRLAARAAVGRKRVATLSLDGEIRFRSAGDRAAFAEDLTAATARLIARYHDADAPGGRVFRLTALVYPRVADVTAAPSPESES